jgi:hypothetical protein
VGGAGEVEGLRRRGAEGSLEQAGSLGIEPILRRERLKDLKRPLDQGFSLA